MQHTSSPTWCIHCGTFDIYCYQGAECAAEKTGRYDSRKDENLLRMAEGIGLITPHGDSVQK